MKGKKGSGESELVSVADEHESWLFWQYNAVGNMRGVAEKLKVPVALVSPHFIRWQMDSYFEIKRHVPKRCRCSTAGCIILSLGPAVGALRRESCGAASGRRRCFCLSVPLVPVLGQELGGARPGPFPVPDGGVVGNPRSAHGDIALQPGAPTHSGEGDRLTFLPTGFCAPRVSWRAMAL